MEIGTLHEKPLHAALKNWYAQPGDQIEAQVDGYFIDIVRGDLLIEIQTRNFAGIKRKVTQLAAEHPLRLVYPVAAEKWIVKQHPDGKITRRKSPKRGQPLEVFRELVSFPALMQWDHFSLEILMIAEEEVRRYDGKKGWRRGGWVIDERRLIGVRERYPFQTPRDIAALLPERLPAAFTAADLATVMPINQRLAGRLAYCLREMGVIEQIGQRGRAYLYRRSE